MIDGRRFLDALTPVVLEAGDAIMAIHRNRPQAEMKGDGSPVTEADRAAEALILAALERQAGDIPVVSEENPSSHSLIPDGPFFLVDPLDGTKEFLRSDDRGGFTVNIALIEDGKPVLGIVHAPALSRLFTGIVGTGAWENGRSIRARSERETGPVAVASVSHRDAETDRWLRTHRVTETIAVGSSLKFCLLACGEADVYPRFCPTMEWDTAAGHAILSAAGGRVETPDGAAFRYGKAKYRNGPFIAWGETRRSTWQ